MKGICVFKRLLFIGIFCLLWLPNFCDIKQNETPNPDVQTNKIESSDASRIKNIPTQQEKETNQLDPSIVLKNTKPNIEYVNNLETKEINENKDKSVESPENDLVKRFKRETNAKLDSSRTNVIDKKDEPTLKQLKTSSSTAKSSSQKASDSSEPIVTHVNIEQETATIDQASPVKETIEQPVKANEEIKFSPKIPSKSSETKEFIASPVPVKPAKTVLEDGVPQQPHYDGMPSFDEWKKMMLAEQEKGGQKVPSPAQPGKKISSQKRRRNYSSFECGAKIVASNAEAEGTSRILNEMVDEYMLNPCKAKIWFVIELCETVQATQIELANFELFSSCPKDFSVYSSDNFPTRDWVPLGTFTAAEQRVLQSFELKQEGFGKFIKIELQSYYGTEHYCPLSVVHIFGTSMVDEYEEMETLSSHDHVHEDDLDRLDIVTEDKKSTNIFGSATDAVINIVKKAAQALGQHQTLEENKGNDTLPEIQNSSGTQICSMADQSENKCKNVPIKADHDTQSSLLNFPIPSSSMHHSLFRLLHRCDQCVSSRIRYYSSAQPHCRFFQAALGPVIFQTLCDWFKEHPIVTQDSASHANNLPLPNLASSILPTKSPPPQIIRVPVEMEIPWKKLISNDSVIPLGPIGATVTVNSTIVSTDKTTNASILADKTKLQPSVHATGTQKAVTETTQNITESISTVVESNATTTSSADKNEELSVADVEIHPTKSSIPDVSTAEAETTAGSTDSSVVSEVLTDSEAEQMTEFMSETLSTTEEASEILTSTELPIDLKPSTESSMDGKFDYPEKVEPISVSGIVAAGQKESVFMRMSNRIKALEINMSLSSQYLQELSQRYRRQMEEMQRAFNRTIGTLNDTAKKAAEKDSKQQETLNNLQLQVANLTQTVDLLLKERSSALRQMMEVHIGLMIVEAIAMITIMSLCLRRIPASCQHHQTSAKDTVIKSPRLSKRRSSVDSCTPPVARKVQKRSASEEALNAGEGVLIIEPLPVLIDPMLKVKKKNRKRNKAVQRSNSNPSVPPRQPSSATHSAVKRASHSEGFIPIALKTKLSSHAEVNTCENCNIDTDICTAVKTLEKDRRPNGAPLQNLTNGSIINVPTKPSSAPSKGREKFSLKKLLKFQKRDSI